MDGSAQTPRDTENTILVEVKSRLLLLEKPNTGERRAAHAGDVLLGRADQIGTEAWVVFEDGYGIRLHRLRTAWDDLSVEATTWDAQGTPKDLFDD